MGTPIECLVKDDAEQLDRFRRVHLLTIHYQRGGELFTFLFGEMYQLCFPRFKGGSCLSCPLFDSWYIYLLGRSEIFLRGASYSPPKVIINEGRGAASVVHWLID
jgi:hypothetical protein